MCHLTFLSDYETEGSNLSVKLDDIPIVICNGNSFSDYMELNQNATLCESTSTVIGKLP